MAGERGVSLLFDQKFFEEDLYKLLAVYVAENPGSEAPAVELRLGDGSVFRLKAKVVAGEGWAAFQIVEEERREAPVMAVIPYPLITQLRIGPADEAKGHIGFRRD
ncbi:MAG: hypothetical protein QJR00_03430 [Bacillota bacterium]|nr:hypothetical protein [Bacillota bacterium]